MQVRDGVVEKLAKDNSELEEQLKEIKIELNEAKKDLAVSNKKINFTKNVTEKQLEAAIENPEVLEENPTLISLYSATLNENDFQIEDDSENLIPVQPDFLKSFEDLVDPNDSKQTACLNSMKNQILHKVKISKISRERSVSIGSAKRFLEQESPSRSVKSKLQSQIPTKQ